MKNYVWTDDDHIADVFDETKTPPTGENGNPQPRRASGSSSNFNVRIKELYNVSFKVDDVLIGPPTSSGGAAD